MNRYVAGIGIAALGLTPMAFGAANQIGINVDYLYDSDNTPLLADVMRTYRTVNTTNAAYNANNAQLDSNGWAKTDAWYFLGDSSALKHADGTYALKFSGQATVTVGGAGNVSQTYDSGSNTTTATIVTNSGVDLTELHFTDTRRDANSGSNTGVANVQLMRPVTPGGSTPYSFSSTFTDQTKTIASKTSVLRFMDYLATNNNFQSNWTDRVKPTDVKLNPVSGTNSRGKGGPLELAVQLGNETNRDIWINIPALASNDYITKMAQLIKYGSDGTNPYTSAQSNPVFKPLNSNLHVYLEYSNETWNGLFNQYNQVIGLAQAEVAAENNNGPMNFGNSMTTVPTYLNGRYTALRTKQIAEMFAGVYGQDALINTVRPILSWQYGNGGDTANQATVVLDGYFNNGKGNYVSTPKPISSYIYGGGSAMYYSATSATSSLTVDKIVSEPIAQMASQVALMTKDLAYTTTFGIKRVAYEGGLSLDGGGTDTSSSIAVKLQALADQRLQQLVVTNHNTWTNQGGDLLVYYFSTDQYKFAMSDEYFSTNTPKLNGLDQLNNSSATNAYSIGTALSRSSPSVISGGRFNIIDNGYSPYTGSLTLKAGNWASYLINIQTAGDYVITASFQTYSGGAANFQLLLGGALIADYQGLLSLNKNSNAPGVLLTLPVGITSLRVLMGYGSPDISLANVTFSPIPNAMPIPEPTSLATLAVGSAALLRRRRRSAL